MPSTIDTNLDLLFGLLALQNSLIDQVQLVAAFQAWTRNKERSLADHLVARGDLDLAQRDVVAALVAMHIKKHGGDPDRSLAALNVGRSTCETLARVGAPDLGAIVARLDPAADSTQSGSDSDRTQSLGATSATTDSERFHVLRPHAQGGLGAVFVALDSELNREVALKRILDRHADEAASRQRFVIEAEVTGGLEHPGIVPVYALGTSGDGRPFYAMRFIRGDSLKETIGQFHADLALDKSPGKRALELRKLLRRFMDVCNAIDYAHARGVLHRDIKPANIIVGRHGETLVVDWGLAKVLGQAGSESAERALIPNSSPSGSAETMPGSALGTPAYMSPEQARGDVERLGPRSDVYSLGATLYVLLTGNPPFVGDDIGTVLRAAQEGKFPAPRKLDPSIDKALEAVCLKAMALEPDERYGSPRALADDLERWMADERVSAWREPWSRSLVRWLSRHRTAVTALGAALLVAFAGLVAVLGVQTRSNAQLTAKNAELGASFQREVERFQLAMDAIKLFHGEVSEDLLLKEKQFGKLRAKLLHGAANFYGKLNGLLEGQTDKISRAALGKAYAELAKVTEEIGNHFEALAVHRKALAVRRQQAELAGATDETILDVSRSLFDCGNVELITGDSAAAVESFKEAGFLADKLAASGRASDASQFVLAGALMNQYQSNRLRAVESADAKGLVERATAILQDLVNARPDVEDFRVRLAAALRKKAVLEATPGECLATLGRARAIEEKLALANPDVWKFQDALATTLNNSAVTFDQLGRLKETLDSLRRALAIWERAAVSNPAVTPLQNNVGFGLNNLGETLSYAGRPAEALAAFSRAKAILQKLVDADPSYIVCKRNLAYSHGLIGSILVRTGRPAEALTELARESALLNELPSRAETGTRDSLARCDSRIAAAQLALGRPGDARISCDRAISIQENLVKAKPANPDYRNSLAESLLRSGQVRRAQGDAAGAAADWQRAIALYAALPPRLRDEGVLEAGCHAMLSSLAGVAGSGMTASDAATEAARAMDLLRRLYDSTYHGQGPRTEPALDPLRTRPDFQLLLLDVAFPADPLAD